MQDRPRRPVRERGERASLFGYRAPSRATSKIGGPPAPHRTPPRHRPPGPGVPEALDRFSCRTSDGGEDAPPRSLRRAHRRRRSRPPDRRSSDRHRPDDPPPGPRPRRHRSRGPKRGAVTPLAGVLQRRRSARSPRPGPVPGPAFVARGIRRISRSVRIRDAGGTGGKGGGRPCGDRPSLAEEPDDRGRPGRKPLRRQEGVLCRDGGKTDRWVAQRQRESPSRAAGSDRTGLPRSPRLAEGARGRPFSGAAARSRRGRRLARSSDRSRGHCASAPHAPGREA